MRLYCKLALLVLAACIAQVSLQTRAVGETYFAIRRYVATVTGDRAMEGRLVSECQRSFALNRAQQLPPTSVVIASR